LEVVLLGAGLTCSNFGRHRSDLNLPLDQIPIGARTAREPFSRRDTLIMRLLLTSRWKLALLSFSFLGLAGCAEDNEAAIKEQASKAKGTIPGSRTAQAQTQEEFYEITPGVSGVGTRSGPIPDRGAGYPGSKR
jgi:hypothetical protein